MEVRAFVSEADALVPAVVFSDGEDSLLAGTVSFPLASFLTADGALLMAESADRLSAWAAAMKVRALARVEEAIGEELPRRLEHQPVRFGGDETHALAAAEVSTTCAVSEGTAARVLHDAADLTTSQWQVLEALEAGEISEAHARVILDQARSLPEEQAERFSTLALRRARTRQGRLRTPSELRAVLRRLRECLHPESLTARKAAARRERGVWFTPEPDGMCTLTARLAAETGMAIFNGLDADARQACARAAEPTVLRGPVTVSGPHTVSGPVTVSGHRMLSELRADALVQRLLGGTDGSGAGAFRAEVLVTIPVGLVLDRGAGSGPPGAGTPETADLAGYGPLDAPTARRLAALAPTWQRLFTDCITGAALGVGRTAYRPPKALRRYLHARDGTCRFPGCTRPATACEPDHTIEWHDGGTTEPGNLAMLCRKHHALKSIGAWTYSHTSPTGDLKWRSPLGREYSTEATQLDQPHHPLRQPDPPPF